MIESNRKNLIYLLDKSIYYYKNIIFGPGWINKIKRFIKNPLKLIIRKIDTKLKYRYPIQVKSTTFFKEKMYTLSSEQDLYLCGFLSYYPEIRLSKFIIKKLDKDSTFIDIGSHHGFYALLAHKILGSRRSVHAFEPATIHFNILNKNIKKYDNITANNVALGNKKGTVLFFENDRSLSTMESSVASYQEKKGARFRNIKTNIISLDEYCKWNSLKPTFLKIDVEGAELQVLKGAKKILTKYKPTIAMEVWSNYMDNRNHKQAISLLNSFGYKPFKIRDDGTLIAIKSIDFNSDIDSILGFENFIFK